MKNKNIHKNVKRSFIIFCATFMLMSIPVAAYGGKFSFSLTFNSDNDNAQSKNYVYRDDIFLGEFAYVTVTKQSKAHNNLKFKILKYNFHNDTITGSATSEKLYKNSYLNRNLTLSYYDKYIARTGGYKLYGNVTKSNCSVSGDWRP